MEIETSARAASSPRKQLKDRLVQSGVAGARLAAEFRKQERDVTVEIDYSRTNEVPGRLSKAQIKPTELLTMAVRIDERAERCRLLNNRFFYRDSRIGQTSECLCDTDYGILSSQFLYFLGMLKFLFFFLATVGLLIDQSPWATGAALFLVSIPIAIQNIWRQLFGLAFKVQAVLRARDFLMQLRSAEVRLQLRARVRAILHLHKKIAGYVSFLDFVDVLMEPTVESLVAKLKEIAATKYAAELDEALAEEEVRKLLASSSPDGNDAGLEGELPARNVARAERAKSFAKTEAI